MSENAIVKKIGDEKLTRSRLKILKDGGLIVVEASCTKLLRCGTLIKEGEKFITDIPYAELLKKTYNFIICN